MLAAMADIVFLMDESGSGDQSEMLTWVKNSIFASAPGMPNSISQALSTQGFSDVRYGLIGFAGGSFAAHSYVVAPTNPDPLFGNAAAMDAALENFEIEGDNEDGWDAFEHLISEYKFRDGAVPVAILLQNQQRDKGDILLF
jgi:hypothetical protein